jgi:catechol 2,3-dioxygenase-like lactoylglutathione lyase family enzyme
MRKAARLKRLRDPWGIAHRIVAPIAGRRRPRIAAGGLGAPRDAISLARPQAVPDSAPMVAPSPLRLDHVVVPVRDAEEARRFYRDTVGLTLVAAFAGDDWGGHRWLMMVYGLGTGGQHLVTVAFEGLGREVVEIYPRDARHCAFAVGSSEEWRRWQTRLSASGAAFWEETHGEQRSLYVVDPSHNVLEITTAETPPFASPGEPPDAVVDRWVVATSRRG